MVRKRIVKKKTVQKLMIERTKTGIFNIPKMRNTKKFRIS